MAVVTSKPLSLVSSGRSCDNRDDSGDLLSVVGCSSNLSTMLKCTHANLGPGGDLIISKLGFNRFQDW